MGSLENTEICSINKKKINEIIGCFCKSFLVLSPTGIVQDFCKVHIHFV